MTLRRARGAVLSFLAGWLASGLAFADSRLIFPRALFQQGRFLGIAIANPTASDATVTLKGYTADGSIFAAAGVRNPAAPRTIPAGRQISELVSQIFEAPPSVTESVTRTALWIEASSPTDGLTGFFIDGDYSLSQMDGSDLSGSGTDLVLPLVDAGTPEATEISIVNPNAGTNGLQVEYLGPSGVVGTVKQKTLGAMSALHGTISSIFGSLDSSVTALHIRAERPAACAGFVVRRAGNSMVAVPAVNAGSPAATLYFPQLADGGGWSTTLEVVNMTGGQVLVTITAYRSDGSLHSDAGVTNPQTRTMAAWGALRESAASLFRFPADTLKQGWIKVEATQPALAGSVEYGAGTNRALVAAQSDPFSRALFSHQALADPFFTGLAILNPSSLAANVEFLSMDTAGRLLGSSQAMFRPGQREAFLVHERIPAALGVNGGLIFMKSDVPIVATQLFGTSNLGVLANVPPQKIATSFDPGQSLPKLRVTPPLAVVETGKTQKFEPSGAGSVSWLVNDIPGGGVAVGTISASGLFSAPSKAPSPRSVTVRAQVAGAGQSAGSTVDLVERETLVSGLAVVTAVAYFDNLDRFFVAEQLALSSAETGRHAAAGNSRVVELLSGTARQTIRDVPGDTIGKIVPFTDRTGVSYLLFSGFDTGVIYRLRLNPSQLTQVATGLKSPKSLALDPVSGNLLVAEQGAGRIRVIPRSQFDPTASAPYVRSEAADSQRRQADISLADPRGLAFDNCSGALLAASGDGTLREYLASRERRITSGIQNPGELLVVYRQGLACSEGTTILATDAGGITRVVSQSGEKQTFLSASNPVRDLAFIPRSSKFAPGGLDAVSYTESTASSATVSEVAVSGVFTPSPPAISGAPAGGSAGGTSSGGTIPYADPAGDTFASASSSQGLKVPDLTSVNLSASGQQLIITLTFSEPMAPARARLPNSIRGFVDMDAVPGGIDSHLDPVRPLSPSGMRVDFYVDLESETLYDLVDQEVLPAQIDFLGNTATIKVLTGVTPGVVYDGTVGVVVGNRLEWTDVAPNAGAIRVRMVF